MTTSTDGQFEDPWSVIELSVEDYSIIFQVTKEVHNLSAERVTRLGVTPDDVSEVLETARAIRDSGKQSSKVIIEVRDSALVEVAVVEGPVGRVVNSILDRRLVVNWRVLLLDVVALLSGRELFLRTGYQLEEISPVVDRFLVSE